MGLIEDGEVSGVIPNKAAFVVHYPGYPSSISRAVQTLGGSDSILKARSSTSNKLELYFRPEDPYSHPLTGQLRPCNYLLLKVSKSNKIQSQLAADIVLRVTEAYHFTGMADYQHVVAVHAEATKKNKRNWTEMEEGSFEKVGPIDLDNKDLMIIVPPRFSNKDAPENLVLRPHSSSAKKKPETVDEETFEINIEPALAIDFTVNEIPNELNWRQFVPDGSELWNWQMVVHELFDERPIWHKDSIIDKLLDRGLKPNPQMIRRLLLAVAYYFSGGPFQRLWIRKGYDPRKDSNSRMFQRIDFRVAPTLKSYCDANSAQGLRHKWEDLCKFRVFPYKCNTSFQLYELDDDYIQEEIRKPATQTTCNHSTGWFSQHVHDSFRLRIMVRFLSLYPEAGAKKLLKSANHAFEKIKRVCLQRDALKCDHDQDIQKAETNKEVNENDTDHQLLVDIDDGEDDDNALDDDGEDDDNALEIPKEDSDALDMLGQEEGSSLHMQAYLNAENNSKNYLQELFDNFSSAEVSGQMIQNAGSSEEEYHIFENDEEESSLDDKDE